MSAGATICAGHGSYSCVAPSSGNGWIGAPFSSMKSIKLELLQWGVFPCGSKLDIGNADDCVAVFYNKQFADDLTAKYWPTTGEVHRVELASMHANLWQCETSEEFEKELQLRLKLGHAEKK